MQLEIIWSYLPFELKTYDLKLTYPLEQTNIQSLSLSKLLKSLEQSKFSLIVVQTMTDNHPRIFGAFIRGKVTAQ